MKREDILHCLRAAKRSVLIYGTRPPISTVLDFLSRELGVLAPVDAGAFDPDRLRDELYRQAQEHGVVPVVLGRSVSPAHREVLFEAVEGRLRVGDGVAKMPRGTQLFAFHRTGQPKPSLLRLFPVRLEAHHLLA